MDRKIFLSRLRERLGELGVDEEYTDKYVLQFERYFNTMTEEEADAQIRGFEDVDGIARNIAGIVNKKQQEKMASQKAASQESAAQNTAAPVAEEENAPKDEADITSDTDAGASEDNGTSAEEERAEEVSDGEAEAAGAETVSAVSDNSETREIDSASMNVLRPAQELDDDSFESAATTAFTALSDAEGEKEEPSEASIDDDSIPEESAPDGNVSEFPEDDGSEIEDDSPMTDYTADAEEYAYSDDEALYPTSVDELSKTRTVNKAELDDERTNAGNEREAAQAYVPASVIIDEPEDDGYGNPDDGYIEEEYEEKIPLTAAYVGAVIASAPIALPIIAAVAVIFGLLIAGCGVLIAALFLALIALEIVGAGLALVGIIYGIIQIFTSLPVGLFELGLGVVICGASLLLGILIYNFARRLLPLIMRWLADMFGLTMHKIGDLYRLIRRECAKLK